MCRGLLSGGPLRSQVTTYAMARSSQAHGSNDPERDLRDDEANDASGELSLDEAMPLTTALLKVSADGLSFATPGHRGGRSCRHLRQC